MKTYIKNKYIIGVILSVVFLLTLIAFVKDFSFDSKTTFDNPFIESITITDIDVRTVQVDVVFTDLVKGYIEYGTTRNYGSYSKISDEFSRSQSFLITELDPEKIYYYQVVFIDASGDANVVGGNTFTSHKDRPIPPGQNLVISLIETATVSTSTARITWRTSRAADGRVEYGTSKELDSLEFEAGNYTVFHEVFLEDLKPDTTYFYRPISETPPDIVTYGDIIEFKTLPNFVAPQFPTISNVAIDDTSNTTAVISWDTSDKVVAGVEFGPTTSFGSYVGSESLDQLSHTSTLSGLSSGTTYYYRIVLVDSEGNTLYNSYGTLTTSGNLDGEGLNRDASVAQAGGLPVVPVQPLLLQVTPLDSAVSFDWLKDQSLQSGVIQTLIVRKEGSALVRSRIDGQIIYDGPSTSFIDIGLKNGREYHYALYSYDNYGRFTAPARFKVIPLADNTQVILSAEDVYVPEQPVLLRDLSLGINGDDVAALQTYLVQQGYYPEGIINGSFDLPTKNAVIRYQKLNEINPAEGYVGPITRDILSR